MKLTIVCLKIFRTQTCVYLEQRIAIDRLQWQHNRNVGDEWSRGCEYLHKSHAEQELWYRHIERWFAEAEVEDWCVQAEREQRGVGDG